ncbi:MAG: antibiotic biosynthesis monooxygenase [Steroidobacteraceae bacterium]|jgi:autoinducer 2-degrading protein|nr:antibiotic biosynthesis monooxygenase [Steroidobacteraceae bacterium]
MSRITFVSRMTIKPGKEELFVRTCRELEREVAANESPEKTLWFGFFKLRDGERRYCVIESFVDEAAEHAHMASPWLGGRIQTFVECVDGTWEREYFDPLPA